MIGIGLSATNFGPETFIILITKTDHPAQQFLAVHQFIFLKHPFIQKHYKTMRRR